MAFIPLPHGRVIAALAALSLVSGAAASAQPALAPHGVISPQTGVVDLDDASKNQVLAAIQGELDRSSLHFNNCYYARFDIPDTVLAPRPASGGFAPALVPQGAPIVRHGLIEVTPLNNWSVSAFPDRNGEVWNGSASLRLFKYRVFTPERGLQADNLLMLHFWEWAVAIDHGALRLNEKIDDPARAGAASALQELIASIYNIPPATISVSAPDRDFVLQTLSRANR